MDFAFTAAQQQLRAEVRDFVEQETTPEILKEAIWNEGEWTPAIREIAKKLGDRGWLTPAWPKQYGGLEASNVDRLIIMDELAYLGLTLFPVGAGMAGPTILHFGTDEQKQQWLPRISSGEIEFALGYTEPPAGSDLAGIDIRAVEDGDTFVISGMKTFNTAAHYADYHWLGARTDPDAPRHKGISLFIVDLKSRGITVRPLWTMAGYRTNEVYYDDVRVPRSNLVGARGQGFLQIARALDYERIFVASPAQRLLEEIVEYAKEARSHGQPLASDPVVRRDLAEVAADIEVGRLLSFRVAWLLDQGRATSYESSMLKVYVTELMHKLTHVGMSVLGPYGQLRSGSKWAAIEGMVERYQRAQVVGTIFAGTSEIQRNIIAQRGLGLPR